MTGLKVSSIVLLSLLCLECAAQQPAAAAKDPVTEAREKLSAVEAAHRGNTVEVAAALSALVEAQIQNEKVTPETLDQCKRELAVAEAASGPRGKALVIALADATEVYLMLNRPGEGRAMAERAFEIAQKEFRESDEDIQASMSLADVCNVLGDFPCAIRADEAAIAGERKPGPDHEWVLASSLSNLGDVKERMGDTAGAGTAIEEALVAATHARPDDPQVGIIESNVGAHYLRNQQFAKAIPHLNRAIDIFTRAFGPDSPYVLSTIANLADIYSRTGQFPLAWKNYELAVGNKAETVDTMARLRANYATSLAAGGNLKRAIDLALESARMGRENFVLQARTLPERQALAYAQQRPRGLDTALSVLARHPEMPSDDTYQEMMRSRALVAEEMARRQKNLNAANNPEIARLLLELNEARAALLAVEGAEPGKQGSSEAVNQATARMEKIERALAERSAAVRNGERSDAVRIEDLRHSLPARSVAISYVTYLRRAVEAVEPARADTPSYLAFVLHPDSNRIGVFDLGEAKAIDTLVTSLRATADAEAHGGGLGSVRNERSYRESGDALRKKIWDPLKPELGDAKLALVVPDGVLNLIPFSALPDGKGYLVEHGPVIHVLTSERDLVPSEAGAIKSGLLAVGSPAFDLGANSLQASALRGDSLSCDEFKKLEFHPLPGAEAEVTDLRSTWKRWNSNEPSSLVTGADATRAHFLQYAEWNRVLHIATHAFLLDKSCGNGNPLLHSGLVFAGANSGSEASILTAQQIASLDLSGVDWAVLSACNTGNGELHDGEGVLGLERAFRVAGARSVVMTLWPVEDDVTRRFMHELYAQRLGAHASTADAVWTSARKLLLERRAAGQSTHPWYWAGFVGSGGWE